MMFASAAEGATVLILRLHNDSQYSDLNWVGESVAETLRNELGAANQIVISRDARAEGMRRLSIRLDAELTTASIIRLGQILGADYVCYGSYEASLPEGDTQLKDSSVRLTAHFLDLRNMRNGPNMSEAGKLAELSRLEEHLAYESLKYLQPTAQLQLDAFLAPQKLIRLEAEESYTRGLLSANPDQQEKWFAQAAALDGHFSGPVFELGRLALDRKEYRQAINWLQRIPPADPRYADARFKMGLSAFGAGDYSTASSYFRELVKTFPLSEIYNNLGAAENQMGQGAAIDDFRHALDGDANDPIYLFNLGVALLEGNYFDEAAKRLEAALSHSPDDAAAKSLLDRAHRREAMNADAKAQAAPRLKQSFDETAFRQLKAMLQPKGS